LCFLRIFTSKADLPTIPSHQVLKEMGLMNTEERLFKQFGTALLTLPQLAPLLNCSPAGLRITLAGTNELAPKLRPARMCVDDAANCSLVDIN